jgi:transglutaminase-like putative cysteine protease
MVIRLGYDIELQMPQPVALIAVLNVHPSRTADLIEPDELRLSPEVPRQVYLDTFGNRCTRILAPRGSLRLWNSTRIRDEGNPDPVDRRAGQVPVDRLPTDTLQFLLASRYCEVDRLSGLAWKLFGLIPPGWARVQAICDWVHRHVTFGYQFARPTKTALETSVERQGVCRDFQHLAIALCRAMHIPARYATGYLGDIGIPPEPYPMDFNAWFDAYLSLGPSGAALGPSGAGGRWWTFDARHNRRRFGRVLVATGRDAADVAITTSFGRSCLQKFSVVTEEVAQVAETFAPRPVITHEVVEV